MAWRVARCCRAGRALAAAHVLSDVDRDRARLEVGVDQVAMDGSRDVLGMWFQETEGAKFWMQILTELKRRGVKDILICCVDGLNGFPEAIEAVFPATTVQTCIVHLIRHSLKYVPRREFSDVARDLKPIYTAIDSDAAHQALEAFDEKWGQRFPVITQAWLDRWEYVTPFLAFSPEIRRVIYTTNAIEALNRQLRKAVKTKGHFPTRPRPASCSTSPSKTPSPHGPEPGTGRPRCWPSRFTSETAYPTSQTRLHRKRTSPLIARLRVRVSSSPVACGLTLDHTLVSLLCML